MSIRPNSPLNIFVLAEDLLNRVFPLRDLRVRGLSSRTLLLGIVSLYHTAPEIHNIPKHLLRECEQQLCVLGDYFEFLADQCLENVALQFFHEGTAGKVFVQSQ